MARQTVTSRQFDDRPKVDVSQHVVVDQNSAQWDFAAQNLFFDFQRHILKVETNDSKLDDIVSSTFQKKDLPTVHVFIELLVEYADIDAGSVVRLHRHRHVMLVDEHLLVRIGRLRRRNMFGPRNQWLAFGEEIEQRFKFGEWVHGGMCC